MPCDRAGRHPEACHAAIVSRDLGVPCVVGAGRATVLLTAGFAAICDGHSIGSNDLTQLTLGLDRDSEVVAHLFDERDPAVKRLVADVIRRAAACGRKVGICGRAPSDCPGFARFLVECGIDSISVTPDSVLRTSREILAAERE